ncbi:phenylalanine--tRNA ligase subunit beta [Candidatus Pacearchaeota archaeon]|nr:phenylalanine--tRNA ligase subunit beta [Candidatus Pacearchaeota archaeon]
MANLKINKQEFEKYIKLTPQIIEKINLFGTPIEKLSDNEIEIEILPNRPDMLSMYGFLRSFESLIGKPSLNEYKISKPKKEYFIEIDPSVAKIRPYTACAIAKNISFDDEKIKEIIDLQGKLHATLGRKRKKVAIGIYPLDKIKLPIKYEARSPHKIKFMPLDYERELNALEILKMHPTGKEYAHLLEGYDKFPLFVDSADKILSMPPIINSNETGKITINTKDVFIECTGFDFNILKKTLNIIVATLADMNKDSEMFSMELRYKNGKEITPDFKTEKISVSLERINKLIGIDIKEDELKRLLLKMGHDYRDREAIIAPWRIDILHEVDIIEDVAIAYGYENFTPIIPNISTIGEESKKEILKRKISDLLVGLGFLETSSYSLTNIHEMKKTGLKNNPIEIEESKSEYNMLRENLLVSSMKILSNNIDAEYPQNIFEIGTIFKKQNSSIEESDSLVVSLCPSNFTKAKQILEYLGKMLNLSFSLEVEKHPSFVEGRTASILLNNKKIGNLGEINPLVLKNWHMKMPVASFEINLEERYKLLNNQ